MPNPSKRTSATAGRHAPRQLFLAFGMPKSGTTFLQRTLNLHPEVSCPSEQSFGCLTSSLTVLLDRYEAELHAVDQRTGGQGIPALDDQLRNNVLGAFIAALARSYGRGKAICGLNENSVINNLAYYDQILGHPKMIAIFRDPVDTAVSLWRHNRHLAKLEPEMAATHLMQLGNPAGTLDGFVLSFADKYKTVANTYLFYAADKRNFVTVRYEDLVADKETQLKRLLQFLGADTSRDTIRRIVAASSREAMASTSSDPEFFGVGRADDDELRVSDETRRRVGAHLGSELARLGYRHLPERRQAGAH